MSARLSDAELKAIESDMTGPHCPKLIAHAKALTAENERLRQRLLTAAGDDLCRLTQEEIKDLTGGKVPIPPKGEFLASCERFHDQIAGEAGVNHSCLTLAQLVAENERLSNELSETKISLEFASATREQADHEIEVLQRQAASSGQGTAAANIGGSETGVEASQTRSECPECHYSAWVISAETGRVLFCKVCDEMSQKRDALQMERELKAELAAAQQRLAALAVDPTKREELVAKCYELFQGSYIEKSEAPPKWDGWSPWFRGGFTAAVEGAFMAGLIAPDPDRASLPEVAELERQLAEANKRLAELTKPADEEELEKLLHEAYQRISNPKTPIPLEAMPEHYLKANREAVLIVAARVRAPLVQQIADLTEKLAAAEKERECERGRSNRAYRRAGKALSLSIRIHNSLCDTEADRDRLAAELATTKQALAAARGEVDRMRAACEPFKAYADEIPAAMPEDYLLVPHELTVREWRELRGAIEPVQSSAPANPAASVPVGLCPKCGIQPLTKEGDDMIRLGEKDYLCGNCKRYLCRPIESKAAASERGDFSHTPDTAHASSSQSEPADHSGEAGENGEQHLCPDCNQPLTCLASDRSAGVSHCNSCNRIFGNALPLTKEAIDTMEAIIRHAEESHKDADREVDPVVDRLLAPARERLEQVRALAKTLGRWPNALDYAEHKLTGKGGQCSCVMMGDCVLSRDSHTCDRRCYADQLRDRLALERENFSPFAEKVEPAERRFVCPICKATEHSEEFRGGVLQRLVCDGCGHYCTWAEVEAAKGEGEAAESKQAVAGREKTIDEIRADRDELGKRLSDIKKQLAAANQAREAEEQRADEYVKEIERRIKLEAELRCEVANNYEVFRDANFWRWQGDGSDYPESLTCQVVMTAEQLRELLQRAEAAEAAARGAILNEKP